jgi:hypothetical protein
MLHIEIHTEGENVTQVAIAEWTEFNSTNALILATSQLWLEMHESDSMTFEVGGTKFLTATTPHLYDRRLLETRVQAETSRDIAAIELLTGQKYEPCLGPYNNNDRVNLRIARHVWEGQVVAGFAVPVTIISPTGNPPRVVALQAKTLDVGGSHVPAPAMCMRHPAMMCRDLGPEDSTGGAARRFEVTPPEGERLLAWSPHLREISSDDQLKLTTEWGLTGIDEDTF